MDLPSVIAFLCLLMMFVVIWLAQRRATNWVLRYASLPGATFLTLGRSAEILPIGTVLVIDPFGVGSICEVRKLTHAPAGGEIRLNTGLLYPHARGVAVLVLNAESASLKFWRAAGNSSGDDTVAIQAALDDQARALGMYWIEGHSQTYMVSGPLVGSSYVRMQHLTLKANKATYAPADPNNAMFTSCQGTILAFTGSAATGRITTAAPHGIPQDGSRIMLKSVSGLEGLVAGRVYYTRDREETSFRICASEGGPALPIDTDGAGTCYAEVRGATRVYLRDVTLDGEMVPGLTGADLVVQQPSDVWKFRVNECPVVGLKVGGQDGMWSNCMTNGCLVGLELNTASMMKFIMHNAEACGTGVRVIGSNANNFVGSHFELNSGANFSHDFSACIELKSGECNVWDGILASLNRDTQAVLRNTYNGPHSGASVGYGIRNCYVNHAGNPRMIEDAPRGLSLGVVDHFQGHLSYFDAPRSPTSDSYQDHGSFAVVGKNGRFVRLGAVDKDTPVLALGADSDQAGPVIQVRGKDGKVVFEVDADGNVTGKSFMT